jgi:FHS family L-fucose permease-like MFS transporter
LVYMTLTVSCYVYIMYYGLRGHAVGTRAPKVSTPSLSQHEAPSSDANQA